MKEQLRMNEKKKTKAATEQPARVHAVFKPDEPAKTLAECLADEAAEAGPVVSQGKAERLQGIGCGACGTRGKVGPYAGVPAMVCENCEGYGAFSVGLDEIPKKKRVKAPS